MSQAGRGYPLRSCGQHTRDWLVRAFVFASEGARMVQGMRKGRDPWSVAAHRAMRSQATGAGSGAR